MLKFFRKIRQNLISDNKFSKYFLYAFGEIILVVIGILIALSINNWNEGRKEILREIKMLSDLKNDIENNIVNINEGILRLEKGVENNQKIILAFQKKVKYDTLMKSKDFAFSTIFWDPDFRYASFENLKKEGVNLISNNSLRNKIIELYEIDMDILDVSNLNRHNDFMNSVGNRILNKYFYFDSETGYQPFDYEKMMSDNEYFSFVTFLLSRQQVALQKSEIFTRKAELISIKITQEIKELR